MEITKHQPGMFSWTDLATPDADGSKKFYTELLELESTDIPMGNEIFYTMLSKGGKFSCALYAMPEEMKQMTGGRAMWQTYFTVASADKTAARIKELGGADVQGPFDVSTSGRMAFAKDPTGAVFAIWQPKDMIGAQVFGEPGAPTWTELYTHDTEAAEQFYSGLFGWSANKTASADGGEYIEYKLDGQSAAGMMAIREEWGEMPAHWSIYFAVTDIDAALEKAMGLGAKTVTPMLELEHVGRFVYLQDPQGGHFTIIQFAHA